MLQLAKVQEILSEQFTNNHELKICSKRLAQDGGRTHASGDIRSAQSPA